MKKGRRQHWKKFIMNTSDKQYQWYALHSLNEKHATFLKPSISNNETLHGIKAYCWRMQFSCRRFSESEKQHCYPSKTTMNAMAYNNAKQYWETSILYKSNAQHKKDVRHCIRTKNIFDQIQ